MIGGKVSQVQVEGSGSGRGWGEERTAMVRRSVLSSSALARTVVAANFECVET